MKIEEISKEVVKPEAKEDISEMKMLLTKIESITIKEKIITKKEEEIGKYMKIKSFNKKDTIKKNKVMMKVNRMNKREK
jgi:hypothetical protein